MSTKSFETMEALLKEAEERRMLVCCHYQNLVFYPQNYELSKRQDILSLAYAIGICRTP